MKALCFEEAMGRKGKEIGFRLFSFSLAAAVAVIAVETGWAGFWLEAAAQVDGVPAAPTRCSNGSRPTHPGGRHRRSALQIRLKALGEKGTVARTWLERASARDVKKLPPGSDLVFDVDKVVLDAVGSSS